MVFSKGKKYWLNLWYPERNVQNGSNLNQKERKILLIRKLIPISLLFGELFPIFIYLLLFFLLRWLIKIKGKRNMKVKIEFQILSS